MPAPLAVTCHPRPGAGQARRISLPATLVLHRLRQSDPPGPPRAIASVTSAGLAPGTRSTRPASDTGSPTARACRTPRPSSCLHHRDLSGADDLVSGAGRHHRTVRHDDQPVALPRLFHVMRRHQHAGALASGVADGLPQPGPAERVDPGGRLVQDQQVRPVRQRLGERRPALQAKRQPADRDPWPRLASVRPRGPAAGLPKTAPANAMFSAAVRSSYNPRPCGT